MTVPFTYLLHHKPTNTFYYGVRWAKDCNPLDFWKTYYTSSKKIIPLLRTLFGDESFEYEIRKIFKSSNDAIKWENKVLRRMKVLDKDIWLNKTNNKAIICKPYDRSKMKNPNIGKKHTKETKEKIRLSRTGKCVGDNNPSKRSEVRKLISERNQMKSNTALRAFFSERMVGNKIGIGNTNAKKLRGRKQSLQHIANRVNSRKKVNHE